MYAIQKKGKLITCFICFTTNRISWITRKQTFIDDDCWNKL